MLRPETVEAAEKEKVAGSGSASAASSSVEGSTRSKEVLIVLSEDGGYSLADWRVILRFFWEDVVKVSCLCSSGDSWD